MSGAEFIVRFRRGKECADVPVMVVTCTRLERPMHFSMGLDAVLDPADNPPEFESVEALTQWYNDALAARIRQQPEQYWWLHDRWKETRSRKRRQERPAAGSEAAPGLQRPAA